MLTLEDVKKVVGDKAPMTVTVDRRKGYTQPQRVAKDGTVVQDEKKIPANTYVSVSWSLDEEA